MKTIKTYVTTIAALLCSVALNAHDFEVNGIYYKIISAEAVQVTFKGEKYYSYDEYVGAVEIPSSVNYNDRTFDVTSIGAEAFSGCTELSSITIPESVTDIEYSAFSACFALKTVTIPSGVKVIRSDAFRRCIGLISITIPEGVTSIGKCSFWECESLESITIPESVVSIDDYAFEGCNSLTSVTIPEGVHSIGVSAFEGCSELISVNLPKNLTKILSSTFLNCTSLVSITIPENIESINNRAFEGCNNIKEIFCHAINPPKLSESAFSFNAKLWANLYVPENSIGTYKTVEGWSEFTNVVAGDFDSPDSDTGILFWSLSPELIQSNGSVIILTGLSDGTEIVAYDTSGHKLDAKTAIDKMVILNTNLEVGEIAIIQIAGHIVKVMIK